MATRVLDIRTEFSKCVRALGGELLDERQDNEGGEIADYWFPQYETIGELKNLEKDPTADPELAIRFQQMVERWIREHKIPDIDSRTVRLNLKDLPIECAREFLSVLKDKLEAAVLSKANRQIKRTKARLKKPHAKGLLLLANDGNLVWKPDMFSYLVGRILKTQFTSIHSVTYFSPIHAVSAPDVPAPSFFWIDGVIPGREPAPEGLRRALNAAWTAHHSTLMGTLARIYEASRDLEKFEQIHFVDVPDHVYRFK